MSIDSPSQSPEVLYEVTPAEAVEKYLRARRPSLRDSTIKTHRSSLSFFLQWCDQNGIGYVGELDGLDLEEYYQWRRVDATEKVDVISKQTAKTQMDILRKFIEFCERIDAVRNGLSHQVPSPDTDKAHASVPVLEEERAKEILDWLGTYEYASAEHVCWALFCSTGMRLGGAHSLDLRDYHPEGDTPYIELRHRPDTGTTLKQGDEGERDVFITEDLCTVIDDYIENRRPNVTDDFGREPLLASKYGRFATSTIRSYVYQWSRPCQIGKGCPHGQDVDDCDFLATDKAPECESSVSPHSIRRGYITSELNNGVEKEDLVGRCDVSEPVLEKHYDKRSESEKMELRRQRMQQARDKDESFGGSP